MDLSIRVSSVGVNVRASSHAVFVALTVLVMSGAGSPGYYAEREKPYLPVGLFIGAIEEGARIFTPVRLLPFDHPESLRHEFPTVLQLRGNEFPMLIWLGERAGLKLRPTLQRYPAEPRRSWPYPAFRMPPDSTTLRCATVVRYPRADAPLPGLRAVLYDNRELVAFIVDTRGISLAERGMDRPTSMGLDVSRAQLLEAIATSAPPAGGSRFVAEIWEAPMEDAPAVTHGELDLSGPWATGSEGEPTARRLVVRPPCNYSPSLFLLEQRSDTVLAWSIPESWAQGVPSPHVQSSMPMEGRVTGVNVTLGVPGRRYVLRYDSTSGHLRGTLNGAPFWAVPQDIIRPTGCIPPP